MCFSPEVDLAAGVLVGAVAVDSLRHVRRPEHLPLAALPAVLAAHQLVEAFVWWGVQGRVSAATGVTATWWYLLVAFGVLPVLVPVAILSLESTAPGFSALRRTLLATVTAIGAGVAATLMYTVADGPVRTRIDGHHVVYIVGLDHDAVVVPLYLVATCGALLLSSHRGIRWYGWANLAVVAVLAFLDRNALVSLWCVWAAATSILIAVSLRRTSRLPAPDQAARTSSLR